jgi:hypothetical protein
MTTKTRKFRPSPAIVISCLALFLALTGSAFAVGVGKNTVRSAQIVDSTVRTIDLRDNAVSSPKIADAAVTATDLGTDSVGSDEIAKDAVKSDEIAKDAVKADEIADNAVTSSEVAPDSLTAGDLAANSVGSSEVADESLTQADLGVNSVNELEVAANAISADELTTVTVRTNATTINNGDTGGVSVSCAAGEQIISGGGQPGKYGVEMTSSLPSGNGWLYQVKNASGFNTTITVYALCLAA